jgi:uncharacterized membrane protein YccC
MEREPAILPPDDRLRLAIGRINERLRIALTLSLPENFLPGVNLDGQRTMLRQRLLGPPRANLSWRSAALRHAMRAMLIGGLALAVSMAWGSPYAHWLTITVVATMQPNFGLTLARSVERVAGTIAGGLVAALVSVVFTTPLAIAAVMFPLAMAALAVRSVSLGLFMIALTPLIVLLVEVGQPDTAEWTIAVARACLTAIGGIVAVAASYLLWPDRQELVLPRAITDGIAAHRDYADAQFARLRNEAAADHVARARRAAGLTSNALETAISQALIERRENLVVILDAALVIDAALRRLAGRISAATLDRDLVSVLPPEAERAWRTWISQSLGTLAARKSALQPRPEGPTTDTLLRIARQIELMAGAMESIAE